MQQQKKHPCIRMTCKTLARLSQDSGLPECRKLISLDYMNTRDCALEHFVLLNNNLVY